MRYVASLHVKTFSDFKFIGKVKANSIEALKEKARSHARNWNERGRVYIEEENTGREFAVNA